MVGMKRSSLAPAAAVGLLAVLVPASAAAKVIDLGATSTPLVAPVCPAGVKPQNCTIVLTQVTALETIRDGIAYPTKVTKAGRIVAFTLGLSRLSSNNATAKTDIHFLDTTYGGTTRAAIAVLKPSGKSSLRRWKVSAISETIHLQPFLGQVVQFPLQKSLPVSRGDMIALSVPTWAPVLSFNLPTNKFAYRQSRASNCTPPSSTEQALLSIGANARFLCNYPGARVEYTATEVTTPAPPKNQIHAVDQPTK
jgi:hypothetical protein